MAMIEAYRIGVELVLGGDLAAGIEALIPGLTRLETGLSQANAQAKGLAAALGSVAATAPGLGLAADAMQRLHGALAAVSGAAEQFRAGGGLPRKPTGTAVRSLPPSPNDPASEAVVTERRAQPSAAGKALAQVVAVAAPASEAAIVPGASPRKTQILPVVTPAQTALPEAAQAALTTADKLPPAEPPQRRALAMVAEQAGAPAPTEYPAVGRPAPRTAAAVLEQVVPTITKPLVGEYSAGPPEKHGSTQARDSFVTVRRDALPQVDRESTSDLPRSMPPRRAPAPAAVMPAWTPAAQPRAVAYQPATARAAPTPPNLGLQTFRVSLDRAVRQTATRTLSDLSRPQNDRAPIGPAAPNPPARQIAFTDAPWQPRPQTRRDAAPNETLRGLEAATRPPPRDAAPLQSYHPQGGQAGPVIQHVTYLQLDERTIARAVTRQQLRMMGGQVSGTLRPDPSIAPHYGAHLLET